MKVKLFSQLRCRLLKNPINRTFSSIERILDKKKAQEYKEKGYVVLPKVFSPAYIEELKAEVDRIISNTNNKEIKSIFDAGHASADNYFLDSGDNVSFFLEKDSWDENGNLKYELKDCLNKIGHGIHDANPKFKSLSYSNEMKYIAKMMGFTSPILAQSMYIFKNQRIGGEVGPHTDNSYIRTKPLSCAGIWVAFDDASKENGCMWGMPGSHLTPTNYFLKLGKNDKGETITYYEPNTAPTYDTTGAVPLEVEKGSVILLHGDFVHFSHGNTSAHQRHAFTLHLVESRGHVWEKDNWLQRKNIPFNFLNETNVSV